MAKAHFKTTKVFLTINRKYERVRFINTSRVKAGASSLKPGHLWRHLHIHYLFQARAAITLYSEHESSNFGGSDSDKVSK